MTLDDADRGSDVRKTALVFNSLAFLLFITYFLRKMAYYHFNSQHWELAFDYEIPLGSFFGRLFGFVHVQGAGFSSEWL